VPKLIRITTAPLSMKYLLTGQMRYMQEHGLDVIMISSEGKEWPDIIANEKCSHHIIHMTRKITPFTDLVSLWKLYRFFKKQKPDIVHSHTPKAGLIAMLAAKFAGVKVRIHTIAGLRFMTSHGLQKSLLVQMEKLTAWAANYTWPNSYSLFNYLYSNRIIAKQKMEVIGLGSSNGINLGRFSVDALDNEKLNAIKQKINFNDSLTYLLCVGRIVKDKGIDELTGVFEKLYRENGSLRLVLVGAFEDELDPVRDSTKQILKNHPGIILTGWSEDVEYYMHLSFVLVHPSYREGFPNVLLQAGAMGCPVICSRIEGNVDIVEHQKTGLLFDVRSEEQLQEQLEFALTNRNVINEYAVKLQARVQSNFSQPVVHRLIYKKYMELLSVHGSNRESEKYESVAGTYT